MVKFALDQLSLLCIKLFDTACRENGKLTLGFKEDLEPN
jgi:hypothetical protein